mmetsp:Transcript_123632/g.344885  ORF Transcript_123632/g.344885 Transcript_123632/m.344885 type:complete len:256 (-) Transcript_123632:76-843(-)
MWSTAGELANLLQCCNSSEAPGEAEFRVVHLSIDDMDRHLPHADDSPVTPNTLTSRQQSLRERIRLPKLRRYPVPVGCSPDDPEEFRRAELLRCFQDFVMELHMGIHMTQLTTHQEYSDIHCQVLDDLQTLKVDQGCGCIVEFPLGAVSKVYRVVKADLAVSAAPFPSTSSEHVVVVEFMRRKLAFVFRDVVTAQRFLMCMELLTRSAQEQAGSGLSGACARRGGGGITPMFSASAPAMRGGRPTAPAVLKEGVA